MQHIFIGTSGWQYADWIGQFYPAGFKSSDELAYYADHFKTVEVNSTFYHMPQLSTVERWHDTVPEDFTFAIKMNRYITHTKRLIADEATDQTLVDFYDRIARLRHKLGSVLVQLPPSMRLDIERLEHLIAITRQYEQAHHQRLPLALEFRHASWFTPEVFAMLRQHNVATVINDSPDRWPATKTVTGSMAYIRFHGNKQLYRSSYTDAELSDWAAFIREQCRDCTSVYAYFNNDYNATAVNNAQTLLRLMR